MSDLENDDAIRQDLLRLGSYLIALANNDTAARAKFETPAFPLPTGADTQHKVDDTPILAKFASIEYRERMRRREHVDADLLGEPAWDLLLDLFIARCSGLRISVTSACIAAQVPATTGLRWLTVLEERNLVLRAEDRHDKRRTWIYLTDKGFDQMVSYLRGRDKRTMVRATGHASTLKGLRLPR